MLGLSFNAAVGHAGLLILLTASAVGALSTGYAIVTNNRVALRQSLTYAWLILIGALVSVFAMQRALQVRDYSLEYVQDVGSSTTPTLYNVAAMWSALEGSILLWVLVLAIFTAAVAWRFRKRIDDALVGWALVVMFVVSGFFGLVSFGPANPFAAGPPVPFGFDGPGPNPLLQNHILVLFHPPILYLGYVGFTVPFAFAIAALITGRVGEGWLMETRRWALFSWGFLTIGILLGGWWSYEVL
ncbi:MAG: cytochrome c biogenesis protein CcsA, partial [Acidimicrobiia bacterium]